MIMSSKDVGEMNINDALFAFNLKHTKTEILDDCFFSMFTLFLSHKIFFLKNYNLNYTGMIVYVYTVVYCLKIMVVSFR